MGGCVDQRAVVGSFRHVNSFCSHKSHKESIVVSPFSELQKASYSGVFGFFNLAVVSFVLFWSQKRVCPVSSSDAKSTVGNVIQWHSYGGQARNTENRSGVYLDASIVSARTVGSKWDSWSITWLPCARTNAGEWGGSLADCKSHQLPVHFCRIHISNM